MDVVSFQQKSEEMPPGKRNYHQEAYHPNFTTCRWTTADLGPRREGVLLSSYEIKTSNNLSFFSAKKIMPKTKS